MKRKMTLLAFAGSGGTLGASGLANFAGPAASAAFADRPKKPSWPNRPAIARPVKPAPASQIISRRVRRQKVPAGSRRSLGGLIAGFPWFGSGSGRVSRGR